MRTRMWTVFAVAALAAGASTAAGQEPGAKVIVRQDSAGATRAVVVDQTRVQAGETRMKVPLEAKIVTGAPYSADVVNESVQALPDGNRIVHQERSRVTRDGQGRVRRETEKDGQVVFVTINDPVAKVSYSLDPAARVAWKAPYGVSGMVIYDKIASREADPAQIEQLRKIEQEIGQATVQLERRKREQEVAAAPGAVPPPPPPPPPTAGFAIMRDDRAPAWDEKVEELAPRQIEGVQAAGKRTTRTIPAGAIGNERPIVSVTEEWRSPDLQVLLLTTTSDPRVGESSYKLLNINRSEPAPSLFEVPSDFTVKEGGVRRMLSDR